MPTTHIDEWYQMFGQKGCLVVDRVNNESHIEQF